MEQAQVTGHDLLVYFTGDERGFAQGKREAFRLVSSLLHGELSVEEFDAATHHVMNSPTMNDQHAQFKKGYLDMLNKLVKM